jgi:hypothetical protein
MKALNAAHAMAFIELREQMGATSFPSLPQPEFVRVDKTPREVETVDEADKHLLETLSTSHLQLSEGDLAVDESGLLMVGGRKVVAYIRDQRREIDQRTQTSEYRFHLCDCTTIRSMRHAGRERRYLVTQRTDGWFEVNHRNGWGRSRPALATLELCKNCREELWRLGLYEHPFTLRRYFDRHDSKVPRTIRRIETVRTVQEYQPDQAERSRAYRELADFRCQCCNVSCPEAPELLELHHRDGDPSNNAHANLAVLCIECHMRQPYHAQMRASTRNQGRVKRVQQLRTEQGIPLVTVTPHVETFRTTQEREVH